MSDVVSEIQASQFESEVRGAATPVVLDFFSTECPPCEALAPKFEAVAEQFKGRVRFYKIYRQGNRDLAAQLSVSSSPTLIFFKNGKEVGSRLMGDIKRSELKQAVEGMLG